MLLEFLSFRYVQAHAWTMFWRRTSRLVSLEDERIRGYSAVMNSYSLAEIDDEAELDELDKARDEALRSNANIRNDIHFFYAAGVAIGVYLVWLRRITLVALLIELIVIPRSIPLWILFIPAFIWVIGEILYVWLSHWIHGCLADRYKDHGWNEAVIEMIDYEGASPKTITRELEPWVLETERK